MEDAQKTKKEKNGGMRCNSKKKTSEMPTLDEFMRGYISNNGKEKPSMNTLRHFIPLLVIQLYPAEEQGNKMKVKGMWEKKPQDWPENVPFRDPNNARKDPANPNKKGSRPTHKTLMDMFGVLIKRYQQNNTDISSAVTSVLDIQQSWPSTPAPFSPAPSSCLSPHPHIAEEHEDRPDILDRVESKVQHIMAEQLVEQTAFLHSITECLVNKYNTEGLQPDFFRLSHDFESKLDCIIQCHEMFSAEDHDNWQKFESQWKQQDKMQVMLSFGKKMEDINLDGIEKAELTGDKIDEVSVNVLQALQARGLLQIRTDVENHELCPSKKIDVHEVLKKTSELQDLHESSEYTNNVMRVNSESFKSYHITNLDGQCIIYEKTSTEKGSDVPDNLTHIMQVAGINSDDLNFTIDPIMPHGEQMDVNFMLPENFNEEMNDFNFNDILPCIADGQDVDKKSPPSPNVNFQSVMSASSIGPGNMIQCEESTSVQTEIFGWSGNMEQPILQREHDPMLMHAPDITSSQLFYADEVPIPSSHITIGPGTTGSSGRDVDFDRGPGMKSATCGVSYDDAAGEEEMETEGI